MNLEYPRYGTGLYREESVDDALRELQVRARFGLTHPISRFERAKVGATMLNQRVDYWITANDHKIPLRVERLPSRPKRKYLKKLIGPDGIPTLLVYAKITLHALVRKVAKCIKLGLDKIRRKQDMFKFLTRRPDVRTMTFEPEGPPFNPYKPEKQDKELEKFEQFH